MAMSGAETPRNLKPPNKIDKSNTINTTCPSSNEFGQKNLKVLDKLLEDAKTQIATKNVLKSPSPRYRINIKEYERRLSPSHVHDVNNSDFISSLLRKNESLLQENIKKEDIIRRQSEKIKTLEQKIQLLQKHPQIKQNVDERLNILEKCEKLQRQVCEMKEFLHDHGLVWVGNRSNDPVIVKLKNKSKIDECTFRRIASQIELLNNWVGLGEARVVGDKKFANVVTFKRQNSIQLTIYADGLCLFSGPFRPYYQHETLQFIQDIMDGYFPSELESRYPSGVPFELIDRHLISFLNEKKSTSGFGSVDDAGYRLGSTGDLNCKIQNNGTNESFTESDAELTHQNKYSQTQELDDILDQLKYCSNNDHIEPLTFNDLLGRLPELKVTKSGQVINLREDLKNEFCEQNSKIQIKYTDIKCDHDTDINQNDLNEKLNSNDKTKTNNADLINLRISSENGLEVYNLKMLSTDTIEMLYRKIDTVRGINSNKPYRLLAITNNFKENSYVNENSISTPYYYTPLLDMSATLNQIGLKNCIVLRMELIPQTINNAKTLEQNNQTLTNNDDNMGLLSFRNKNNLWNPTLSVSTNLANSNCENLP